MKQICIFPQEIKCELLAMLDISPLNKQIEIGISDEIGLEFVVGMFSYLDRESYEIQTYDVNTLDCFFLTPKISFDSYRLGIEKGLSCNEIVETPLFFGQFSSIWNYWGGHESYALKAEKAYRGCPYLLFMTHDRLKQIENNSVKSQKIVKKDTAYENMLMFSVHWRSLLPVLKNLG